MNEKYSYKLRPAYHATNLLIEFVRIGDANAFTKDLLELLLDNGFTLENLVDVWMNDEIWINLRSKNGKVTITKDIWDNIFILANDNQMDINAIDEILVKSVIFKKEIVDFNDYKRNK